MQIRFLSRLRSPRPKIFHLSRYLENEKISFLLPCCRRDFIKVRRYRDFLLCLCLILAKVGWRRDEHENSIFHRRKKNVKLCNERETAEQKILSTFNEIDFHYQNSNFDDLKFRSWLDRVFGYLQKLGNFYNNLSSSFFLFQFT